MASKAARFFPDTADVYSFRGHANAGQSHGGIVNIVLSCNLVSHDSGCGAVWASKCGNPIVNSHIGEVILSLSMVRSYHFPNFMFFTI